MKEKLMKLESVNIRRPTISDAWVLVYSLGGIAIVAAIGSLLLELYYD